MKPGTLHKINGATAPAGGAGANADDLSPANQL